MTTIPVRRFLSALMLIALASAQTFMPLVALAEGTESIASVQTETASEEEAVETPVAEEEAETAVANEAVTEPSSPKTLESDLVSDTEEIVLEEPEPATNASTTIHGDITVTTTSTAPSATTTEETQAPDPVEEDTHPEPANEPTIVSGSAVAVANILNIVNTTFVNSEGSILLSNYYDPITGTIDFRSTLPFSNGVCSHAPCVNGDSVRVNVQNDAHIDNTIVVHASSGGNEILGGDTASIATGDAYAGLNLINMVNATFVDSNYLLVTMNAFQGMTGDLVFPNLSQFFASLSGTPSDLAVSSANDGSIDNAVSVSAGSGNNTIDGALTSSTVTGDAASSGNVFNQLNSSLVGGASAALLFNVREGWGGRIFSTPVGFSRIDNADGSFYLFQHTSNGTPSGGSTTLLSTSTALIRNNADVHASTGDNRIENADAALISTGNAYAGANIVNIANANVIGRNWMLAIVNIFGDFEGDIAFGRPDLWVGEQVSVPATVGNGSELTYTFSVINNGDSDATETVLTEEYDTTHIEILSSSLAYHTDASGKLSWNLGTLPSGQATEITYVARVKNAEEGTEIRNTVRVSAYETDNNIDDNVDTATVVTSRSSTGSSHGPREVYEREEVVASDTRLIDLSLLRSSTTTVLTEGMLRSRQEVTVRNESTDTVHKVLLHDLLYAPDGTVLRNEPWDIGTLLPNEEIVVGYDIDFASDAPAGRYQLSSEISAEGMSAEIYDNGEIVLEESPATPVAENDAQEPTGSVLGAFIEALLPKEAHAAEGPVSAGRDVNPFWILPLLLFTLLPAGYCLAVRYVMRNRYS